MFTWKFLLIQMKKTWNFSNISSIILLFISFRQDYPHQSHYRTIEGLPWLPSLKIQKKTWKTIFQQTWCGAPICWSKYTTVLGWWVDELADECKSQFKDGIEQPKNKCAMKWFSFCLILFFISFYSFLGGLLTWSNEDDQMNLTKPWQWRTLIIELDQIETNKPSETDKP